MSLQRESDQKKESVQKKKKEKENENHKKIEKNEREKPRKMQPLRENQRENKRISMQERVR